MKEGSAERVSQKIEQRMQRVIDKIEKQMKGVTPFGKRRITPDEFLNHIENSGYLEDPTELINEFGYEATENLLTNYWAEKRKRAGVI